MLRILQHLFERDIYLSGFAKSCLAKIEGLTKIRPNRDMLNWHGPVNRTEATEVTQLYC